MKNKNKIFKKDEQVFVVKNFGSHHTVSPEVVFRFEELKGDESRVFMCSNTSAAHLSKDIFKDERQAEHEAARRNKQV